MGIDGLGMMNVQLTDMGSIRVYTFERDLLYVNNRISISLVDRD
jgi:hypothetical protein